MARNRAQKQDKSNIKKKQQFFNNLAIHKTSKFKFWLSSLRGDNEQSHDCYVNKDLARKLPRRSVCGGSRWSSIPVLALIHRLTSAGVHDAKIHSGTAWRTWLSRNWISAGYQRLICPALNTITPHGRRISAQTRTTDQPAVIKWEAQRLSFIAGDADDPKCPGFNSVKPRKVGGRSTSPEGRAVLHQTADEGLGGG